MCGWMVTGCRSAAATYGTTATGRCRRIVRRIGSSLGGTVATTMTATGTATAAAGIATTAASIATETATAGMAIGTTTVAATDQSSVRPARRVGRAASPWTALLRARGARQVQ